MERAFTIRFEQSQIDDVWKFAEEIKQAMGLTIYWTIITRFPGQYWLDGNVLS